MIFKLDGLQKVKLVMWEKTNLPESKMVDVEGKKGFQKTGKEIEHTTYSFRDGSGEKLVFLSKENGYRDFEGEFVDIEIDVKYNEFTKKTQTRLSSCRKASNLDV